MAATALIPGKLYRVRGEGIDIEVFASGPLLAIIVGFRISKTLIEV